VQTVIDAYLARRLPGERFADTYRRVGRDPFREALYEDAA